MTTLRSIGDGIIITDSSGAITNANPVAEKLLGRRLAAINGRLVSEVINLHDQRDQSVIENPVMTCLQTKEINVVNDHDIVIRRSDDTTVPIQTSVAPILDDRDQLMGTIMVIHDVTEQRELLQKIEHQAFHDPLTGLINRHALMRELDLAWSMSREHNSEHVLVFIDLDRFKIVNDTCGHHAGDELLKGLTSLIRQQIRVSDILSGLSREEGAIGDALARVGGDEFALFLYDCPLDAARRISQQIIEDIREYVFVWDDQQFRVGASIGIATMTANNTSINEVIRNADSACYEAKNLGRGKVCIHTTDHEQIDRRHREMAWVPRLNQALVENHFVLNRQSIVPLSTDDCRHQYYEVLISLKGRGRDEYIAPNAFLPAAERYHLMVDIDRWVLSHAFAEMSKAGDQDIYSINLSADSLGDIELLDYILSGIDYYRLSPQRLIFEISGNAAIGNMQTCQSMIDTLRRRGCRFALGDFGLSLSYFSYMKTLKVDFVKIDGILMKHVADDPMDYTIVESINRLAQNLGMLTVAEHVEDEACLNAVMQIGVDYVQGWAVGLPSVWNTYSEQRRRAGPD
jgi:diguanylate cyclase (GGDEF)-like protein/PAS domain S-box-containing protein